VIPANTCGTCQYGGRELIALLEPLNAYLSTFLVRFLQNIGLCFIRQIFTNNENS
jgi:hypothetical protein